MPHTQIRLAISHLETLIAQATATSLAPVVDRYLLEHVEVRQKPATQARVRRECERIAEWFGAIPVADVGNAHALEVHRRLPKPSAALLVCTLRTLLRKAQRWGLRGPVEIDPALAKATSRPRTTVVLGDDMAALVRALDELDATPSRSDRLSSATALIRFLLGTGLRLGEGRLLTWERVAGDCSSIYLDDSKTGPRHVVLGAPIRALLAALRQGRSSVYVFPGRDGLGPIGARTVQVAMREAARIAGLSGVVCHTARHSWATRALQLGVHNRLVQEALGWSTERQLKRYAHVQAEDLRKACDVVALIVKGKSDG